MKDYKEILKGIVGIIRTTEKSDIGFANICTYIGENCPELQENEDERIRKAQLDYWRSVGGKEWHGVAVQEAIAWLEKQGDKDKLIKELGEYKVKYTQEVLEKHINSMSNKDDERLRKTTISFLKKFADKGYENAVECIDWLEVQGEQNIANSAKTCKNEHKPADKVEPKFKVGDWVVWDNKILCHIDNVYRGKETLMYTITDANNMTRSYSVKSFDNNAHFWTIADAKDGDVLVEDSCIFIIQKLGDNSTAAKTYCTLYNDGDFDDGSILYFDIDSTKPAAKEQRELLFQKIKEAGYEWNAEKKELRKMEQKSRWTEEDEKNWLGIMDEIEANKSNAPDYDDIEIYDRYLSWIESLKQRIL